MSVVVRSLRLDDLEAAVSILQAGSLTPDAEDPEDLEAYWRAVLATRGQRGDVLVAELDGDVAGVCQLIIFTHFQHTGRSCAELESVHVRHDLRSRGIGAELLAHAERLARAAGCYRIQLTSRSVRVDAHRFYESNGYVATSQGFKKSLLD
jgi:GNAT superfamily N-acetyltransferase